MVCAQRSLRCYPYHRIMCWGHNSEIFKFRTFVASKSGRDAAMQPDTRPAKPDSDGALPTPPPPEPQANDATSAGAATAGGGTGEEAQEQPDGSGSGDGAGSGGGAGAGAGAGTAGGVSTSDGADAPTPAPAARTNEELVNIIVSTRRGGELEAAIMKTVKELMHLMEATGLSRRVYANICSRPAHHLCAGIGSAEFAQLCDLLQEDGDRALEAVRQTALSRRFDIKQAVKVVTMIGDLSPFDKVEAATILYGALINPTSFPLVLDTFEDPADRENLCHRLDITLDESGNVVPSKRRNKA